MLKHLNPSMGFGRVYGEWVLALWQSRNGDYILWKDRVPSIHSSCIWFNFFSPFYTVHHFFLSLSISFAIVVLFDVVHLKYFECMNVVFVYVFMYKCSYRRNATGIWTNLQYYANFYIGLWELYLYIFWCGFGVCVCVCWFSRWTGGKHSIPRDLQQYYWQYGHNHLDATKVFNHVQDLSFNEWIHDFFKCISCLNKEMDGFMYS